MSESNEKELQEENEKLKEDIKCLEERIKELENEESVSLNATEIAVGKLL